MPPPDAVAGRGLAKGRPKRTTGKRSSAGSGQSGVVARDAGRESIGGGILIPIPLWYQQGGEIAGALAKKRQAEAKLLLSQNELEQSITQNLQLLEAATAQRKVYEEGFLKQAKEAVRIAQVSFQHGEASLLELLDAQRVLWQTLRGFAKAQFDLSAAFVHLERSLGAP